MNKLWILTGLLAASAWAEQQYVFPKNGQTPEQQKKDEYDCHTWATQQTGYDPVAAAQTTTTTGAAAPVTAAPVKGAARGAAMGAAVGAIAGDAGKGAAIGATAGGMGGAMRRADQRQRAAQTKAVAVNDTAKLQGEYQKARAACLDAKGYSVK